jgi:hypothetical protein
MKNDISFSSLKMMTFVVESNFMKNFKILDDRRLGKQRVEAMQILNILKGKQKAFANHPIVKGWKGYEHGLKYYINCCIYEWIHRGHKNKMEIYELPKEIIVPWWVFWEPVLMSHRVMLMRKDPFFYKGKFDIIDEYYLYGYIWASDDMWKDRNLNLSKISSPIPKFLVNPKYCSKILMTGENKGKCCNNVIKDNHEFCGVHR